MLKHFFDDENHRKDAITMFETLVCAKNNQIFLLDEYFPRFHESIINMLQDADKLISNSAFTIFYRVMVTLDENNSPLLWKISLN